jgi:glycosyltransferase involved in cell wall biosynthesis
MISVCIATYNGEMFIHEQISSIMPQLSESDEIIISDDSSTDHTIDIIKSFNDKRIKVFDKQIFKNPTFNFEFALKQASGHIIFLSDQDDVWYHNKVDLMLNSLLTYDLVVCDCHIGNGNLKIIKDSHFKWRESRTGIFKNLYKNSYLGCCMAFNRKILNKALPFPKYIPMFDTWIGLIGEVFFKTYFLDKKLMIYRRHDNNVTKVTSDYKSTNNLKIKILNRVNFFIALLNRIIFKK